MVLESNDYVMNGHKTRRRTKRSDNTTKEGLCSPQ
jgi:hypothetical protein